MSMEAAALVSGGVDSSVALAEIKSKGYKVKAFYLKVWIEGEFLSECPWEEDLSYVRDVCRKLNVDLEVVSIQREYEERIIAYTLQELRKGNTPSPDVLCNSLIKFGLFMENFASQFNTVVTGHYAQKVAIDSSWVLKKSPDKVKDQTYFLATLPAKVLEKVEFPVGKYTKSQVRKRAKELGLPTAERKDSQGLCFLGKVKFKDFVRFYLGEKKGKIVEFFSGKILGSHNGYWFFTSGQRSGLGLSGGPWYVIDIDPVENTVFVIHKSRICDVKISRFVVEGVNKFLPTFPAEDRYEVKVRHSPLSIPADVEKLCDRSLEVNLSTSDIGLAKGQFAVFYKNQLCLAGGVIKKVFIDKNVVVL